MDPDKIQNDLYDVSPDDSRDIYVGYSDKDLDFVLKIVSWIENEGLSCYVKDRDELSGYMLENLCIESRKSHLVLIIYTEHSLKDFLMKFLIIQSLHETLAFGKLSLKLLLHNIEKENLPKEVLFVPHVFTSEKNYFDKLIEKLRGKFFGLILIFYLFVLQFLVSYKWNLSLPCLAPFRIHSLKSLQKYTLPPIKRSSGRTWVWH